eukprot:CAMPEP_0196199556 /NCGR_PEP_ID=MMETSP0912-20130531/3197_1 /TAXON_ID=49265 /ORGANISM="Thalassiosira rotula, Strain GSO102" /LENGTH=52 /DNA_ID=CAMNT_0041472775 /DNA_START=485 /DNA_END=643 /DNA_ORIENTATION=+
MVEYNAAFHNAVLDDDDNIIVTQSLPSWDLSSSSSNDVDVGARTAGMATWAR